MTLQRRPNAEPLIDPATLPGEHNLFLSTLPNGIRVAVRPMPTVQSVSLAASFSGGALHEPDNKPGLDDFVSGLLNTGTRRYDFEALHDLLEGNAIRLGAGGGHHTNGFGGSALAEDLPQLLALGAEMVRYPSFPSDQMERIRGQIITGLQRRQFNTGTQASLALRRLLYPNHPYQRDTAGTPESVTAITRDDLIAHHAATYGPRDGILVIVGNVDPHQASQWVADHFADWENPHQPSLRVLSTIDLPAAPLTEHVFVPGKSQTTLLLAWPGPDSTTDEYDTANQTNSVLGRFGLNGRLGQVIREQHGLAYSVSSGVSGGFGPGPWRIAAGVDPANRDRAAELALSEVRRLLDTGITEQELADVQSFLVASMPLRFETPGGQASAVLEMLRYNYPLAYWQHYPDKVRSITRDQALAVASKYLNPDRYVQVSAGPE